MPNMKLNERDVEEKSTAHALGATAITFDGHCSARLGVDWEIAIREWWESDGLDNDEIK